MKEKRRLGGTKSLEEIVGLQPIFFKPNTEMVKWIGEYANGRIIIDAGCGEKFLLSQQLWKAGYPKLVAIDPVVDHNELMKLRMLRDAMCPIHIMARPIEEMSNLYDGSMTYQKVLLVFARPCHSDFVENALDLKGPDVEALYITVPENWEKYDDLGKWRHKAKLVEHKGSSADKEVIYSII